MRWKHMRLFHAMLVAVVVAYINRVGAVTCVFAVLNQFRHAFDHDCPVFASRDNCGACSFVLCASETTKCGGDDYSSVLLTKPIRHAHSRGYHQQFLCRWRLSLSVDKQLRVQSLTSVALGRILCIRNQSRPFLPYVRTYIHMYVRTRIGRLYVAVHLVD